MIMTLYDPAISALDLHRECRRVITPLDNRWWLDKR